MKLVSIVLCVALISQSSLVFSQAASEQLDDDFSASGTLTNWTWLHTVEGWPDKVKKQTIVDGHLVIEPGTSGWFADKNAPFLYKEVKGDFDVRARIKATGLTSDISQTIWSLGGLMVRVPKKGSKDNWQPKDENWLFMTVGVAEQKSKQVIETKYTSNSRSHLKLRDAKAEWITLRIVRVGNAFILLYRYDADKQWTAHERFYLMDWPSVLQIGFNAYTNSMAVPPDILWGDPFKFNTQTFDHLGKQDFRLMVDFINFKKPKQAHDAAGNPWLNQVYANRLTDYSLTNDDILLLLGD
jgi:regulation of enolase protein 1 (concanavalin A-like superfamily)